MTAGTHGVLPVHVRPTVADVGPDIEAAPCERPLVDDRGFLEATAWRPAKVGRGGGLNESNTGSGSQHDRAQDIQWYPPICFVLRAKTTVEQLRFPRQMGRQSCGRSPPPLRKRARGAFPVPGLQRSSQLLLPP